ncbi:MAG: galactose mutarotase-like enzyme [Cyclobacteriaceae bacterium]|jgi:galactose mutarotase-like enzyme
MDLVENSLISDGVLDVLIGDDLRMQILNRGAALNALVLGERKLLCGYRCFTDYDFRSARSAILFPSPNRPEEGVYYFQGKKHEFPINEPSNNNSLHGFVKDQFFCLKAYDETGLYCDNHFAIRIQWAVFLLSFSFLVQGFVYNYS